MVGHGRDIFIAYCRMAQARPDAAHQSNVVVVNEEYSAAVATGVAIEIQADEM